MISSKQRNILAFPYTKYDTLICEGAIRTGKTQLMTIAYVDWAMENFDRQNFIIIGKTVGSAWRNVVEPYVMMGYPKRDKNYKIDESESRGRFTVENDNRKNLFRIFGANDDSSYKLIQGFTAAGCFVDEAAICNESAVNQALARCSVDGSRYFFNCNPSYPSHWFKRNWVDRSDEHNALLMHFNLRDNPSLSEKTIERFERQYSGVFYDRYILGLWTQAEGLIYDMYQDAIEDMFSGEVSKYAVSLDYGTQNAFHALLWAFDGEVWHCIDEYRYSGREQGHQKTDKEYGDDMEAFCPRDATIIIDPSASSFIAEMSQRGFYVLKADNDVLDGIRHVSSCMTTGRIRIGDNCVGLIGELAGYVWDDKASDKPIKENDHGCDAMRYFVETLDVWDEREAYEPGVIFH